MVLNWGYFTFARGRGETHVSFFFNEKYFIMLASILIVYDYCVPVQMVMQMAMGAMQVCVSVQTFYFIKKLN